MLGAQCGLAPGHHNYKLYWAGDGCPNRVGPDGHHGETRPTGSIRSHRLRNARISPLDLQRLDRRGKQTALGPPPIIASRFFSSSPVRLRAKNRHLAVVDCPADPTIAAPRQPTDRPACGNSSRRGSGSCRAGHRETDQHPGRSALPPVHAATVSC